MIVKRWYHDVRQLVPTSKNLRHSHNLHLHLEARQLDKGQAGTGNIWYVGLMAS
jgi:hypothetical protein